MKLPAREPVDLVSLQAPNGFGLYRGLVELLGRGPGRRSLRFREEGGWEQAQARLLAGEVQVASLCGTQYLAVADSPDPCLELLVAPVPAAPRYQDQPVYFSDVVVRSDSDLGSWADLEGRSWSLNEPTSHSGYNLVGFELARRGRGADYFSRVVEAGSHETSLGLVLRGRVDAAAIDSLVLEQELRERPELSGAFRVVEVLGPSPAPPLVAHRNLDPGEREALREELAGLHRSPDGAALLARFGLARFDPVRDRDYDPMRRMLAERLRAGVEFSPSSLEEVAGAGRETVPAPATRRGCG